MREIIQYIQTVDEVGEAEGKKPQADTEILQEVAFVYLSPRELFHVLIHSIKYHAAWRLKKLCKLGS